MSVHSLRRAKKIENVDILGLSIASGKQADCIAEIDAEAENGKVALGFVNIYTAYHAVKGGGFQNKLSKFLLLNDGVGLDLVSRIMTGRRFENNLNGTDFIPAYLAKTARTYRVYLLGAKPGVAERAQAELERIAPRHRYAGCHHGFFSEHETATVLEKIRASGADLVVVALGNPAQEAWIADNLDQLDIKVAIGAGACLDFLAGEFARAPLWVRRIRLEWLHRLAIEPRRLWKRYMIYAPYVLVHAGWQALRPARPQS